MPLTSSTSSNSIDIAISGSSGTEEQLQGVRMELLRKLSVSSTEEMAWLQQFLLIEKEFDNEEKMMEFIRILTEKNKLPYVVNYIVKHEIDRNKSGLLREESLGSSLLRNYWFNFEGKPYLKSVVTPLVKEVISMTKSKPLEIDPNKVPPEQASKNLNKLLAVTKSFLQEFCHSQKLFPSSFGLILHEFYVLLTETEGKKSYLGLGYSEDALRLFGAFLLLRFICPAIVSPKRYGLVKNDITMHTQRALVLISKVLQAIASQVEFEGEKEPYMIPANDFVKDNMPALMGFFLAVAEGKFIVEETKEKSKKKDSSKKLSSGEYFSKSKSQ